MGPSRGRAASAGSALAWGPLLLCWGATLGPSGAPGCCCRPAASSPGAPAGTAVGRVSSPLRIFTPDPFPHTPLGCPASAGTLPTAGPMATGAVPAPTAAAAAAGFADGSRGAACTTGVVPLVLWTGPLCAVNVAEVGDKPGVPAKEAAVASCPGLPVASGHAASAPPWCWEGSTWAPPGP